MEPIDDPTLLARYRAGDLDGVEAGCAARLALGPPGALPWQLAGLVHARRGRFVQAVAHFDRALGFGDAAASQHPQRGHALLAQEEWQPALESYERAMAAGAADAQALNNRGIALQSLRRPQEALDSFTRALELQPDFAAALLNRGELLLEMGRRSAGIAALRAARAAGADDAAIGFTLASLGVEAVPAAPPADFVRTLFDQYAERFDAHLTGALGYRAPALVLQALAEAGLPPGACIADLGCGTGLCGPGLRPLAGTLLGVDLSPNMLARAGAHGVYDRLDAADLVQWLQARPPASLDAAVAADVLNYLGDLAPAFAALRHALRPGAALVFTVEALVGDEAAPAGFLLRPTRRYAHDEARVRRLAGAAGFAVATCRRETLRREGGAEVPGWLFSARAASRGS